MVDSAAGLQINSITMARRLPRGVGRPILPDTSNNMNAEAMARSTPGRSRAGSASFHATAAASMISDTPIPLSAVR